MVFINRLGKNDEENSVQFIGLPQFLYLLQQNALALRKSRIPHLMPSLYSPLWQTHGIHLENKNDSSDIINNH